MLLRFTASNFLSLGDELEFTMFPYTRLREHKDHVHNNDKVLLLKAAAIYGANGAGKSNMVKAMQFVQSMLGITPKEQDKSTPDYFLLDHSKKTSPSSFEYEFELNGEYFAYGFEILGSKVIEEWLYRLLPDTKEEQELLFERKGKQVKFHNKYGRTEEDRIRNKLVGTDLLDSSILLLPKLARLEKYPEAARAMFWFADRLITVFPHSKYNATPLMVDRFRELGAFINDVLPKLDTGVESVVLKQEPFDKVFGVTEMALKENLMANLPAEDFMRLPGSDVTRVVMKDANGNLMVSRLITTRTSASGHLIEFELSQESDGTQRLLDLLVPLYSAISMETTVIIDELGRSLHPVLLKSLVAYIMRTPMKGQLIFTTHEEHLLDLDVFRKDEIFFLDKDKGGNTKISRLSHFKARNDLDIQKGFVNGRFGAVPVTRKLDFEKAGYVAAE